MSTVPIDRRGSRLTGLLRGQSDGGTDILVLFVVVQVLCIVAALLFPE